MPRTRRTARFSRGYDPIGSGARRGAFGGKSRGRSAGTLVCGGGARCSRDRSASAGAATWRRPRDRCHARTGGPGERGTGVMPGWGAGASDGGTMVFAVAGCWWAPWPRRSLACPRSGRAGGEGRTAATNRVDSAWGSSSRTGGAPPRIHEERLSPGSSSGRHRGAGSPASRSHVVPGAEHQVHGDEEGLGQGIEENREAGPSAACHPRASGPTAAPARCGSSPRRTSARRPLLSRRG